MKFLKIGIGIGIGIGIVVLALLVLVFSLPITTTPGFIIGGTASAAPTTWENTSSIDEIRLRVPGTIPRVVIIWFVEIDNDLYVVGENASGWVTMLGNGGPVHVRIGDSTYPLQANLLSSDDVGMLQAWEDKYIAAYPEFFSSSADEEFLESSSIYRLRRM